MKYFSTAGDPRAYSFKEGVLKGLAPDRGLYFPEKIPTISKSALDQWSELSNVEIGMAMMTPFVSENIDPSQLKAILEDTLSFPFPIKMVTNQIGTLELFHGPTLAFKDVGARFMSRCLRSFRSESKSGRDVEERTIVLVATSGDTGSAVANGFIGVEGVEVIVLYPAGKVSPLQEKQFATLGKNITSIKVNGTFDDCQSMVKQAFLDSKLNEVHQLSSANSINLARWLPQSIYYGIMMAALMRAGRRDQAVIAVPSGNFGNLTAGILAQKMGVPIKRFVAATNANDVVPVYLKGADYIPKPSVETLANAMDVGDPSNFIRLLALFDGDEANLKTKVKGASFDDDQIKSCIRGVYRDFDYLLDPHGATGFMALENELLDDELGLFLETAHPAKFKENVESSIGSMVEVPERLARFEDREVISMEMENDFSFFRDWLLSF